MNWLCFVYAFIIVYVSWKLTAVVFGALTLSGIIKYYLTQKEDSKDE